jgi:subtilase family serine protease
MPKPSPILLTIAAIVGVFTNISGSKAQTVQTHHVREAISNGDARLVGRLPADQIMKLNIVLPLGNSPGLDAFLSAVTNPASPAYRQFLTPSEFTAKFGPSQANYTALVSFLTSNGFTVTGGSRDGMDVQVSAPVSAVESAFHITLNTYQHPTENRIFYGPDTEPTTALPFSLWHISGLDNYSIPKPRLLSRSEYAAANNMSADGVVSHATTGSGPSASFLGSDMRAAYYGGSALTGAGQNLGLLEYLGTDLADLNTYFSTIGQTNNVPITLLSTDGTSTSCVDSRAGGNCDDTEQTLDMTQAIGMAPALSSLVMYIGSTDTAIISAMTTHNPLPTTIGCSWGWTPADASTLDPYFKKMAVQGQTFLVASGDSSTWTRKDAWPADDANVVAVGGTDLATAGAAGPWQSETAWVDSGGGISPDSIAIPSYQQLSGVINSSNRGSTTLRNGPDISANANFTFYTCADQKACLANEYGGTSFAAPMWAGYLALINQQLAANGQSPVGFINPTIYQQNVTASTYAADFHDIVSGTSGSYSAVTGFDLVTGWGSPNSGLIAALTGSSTQTPAFTIGASPTSLSVTAGSSGTSTISTSVSGGFNSPVALTASGMPSGVTVGFNPSTIAAPGSGSSIATFTVAANTAAGTYSVTITGTGGVLTHTTTVSLTVTAQVTGGFTVSPSQSSLTVARSSSGSTSITTAVTGSFNSSIALSASGGSGLTISFNPALIAAPGSGSSTMRITASRRAAVGNQSITVTATGGGITHTTTVTVDVTR